MSYSETTGHWMRGQARFVARFDHDRQEWVVLAWLPAGEDIPDTPSMLRRFAADDGGGAEAYFDGIVARDVAKRGPLVELEPKPVILSLA